MKKKPPTSTKDAEEGDDGEGGGSTGSGSLIPSYYDIYATNIDEAEITALAQQALLENRISIKSKGIAVSALDKPQEARNRLQNDNNNPGQDSGGLGLEEHPDLPPMGGMVDPNIIKIPQSEQDALAVKDLDLKLELLAKYKKKMDMKMGMALKEQPRPGPTIRPTNAPSRPKPRPY